MLPYIITKPQGSNTLLPLVSSDGWPRWTIVRTKYTDENGKQIIKDKGDWVEGALKRHRRLSYPGF